MKVLSVRQPWAWLLVNGHKTVENRSRRTSYRGPILIHASLKHDLIASHQIDQPSLLTGPFLPISDMALPKNLPLGGIVGMIELTDCVEQSSDPWFTGPFGWVVANAKRLPFVAMRGKLGLFDAPVEVLSNYPELTRILK
jgi:hypothetical protein